MDDPNGTLIYNQTMTCIETLFPDLLSSISIIRLAPNDQLLNSLLSASHIVLQLSTQEGFEVKVSEAFHKGKPIITTNCGGIPLQVQHGKNGYQVEPRDWHAVGAYLIAEIICKNASLKRSRTCVHSNDYRVVIGGGS
jgi:glycosyltransferase involved in cell wall biosynthesis